jgi:hypothetical protein
MVEIGMTAIDIACEAIKSGNLEWLWDQRPALHLTQRTGNEIGDILAGRYLKLMSEIARGKRQLLLREEVQDILAYVVGGVSLQPFKFTSTVKHHGILFQPTHRDGKSVRGIKIDWKINDHLMKEILE